MESRDDVKEGYRWVAEDRAGLRLVVVLEAEEPIHDGAERNIIARLTAIRHGDDSVLLVSGVRVE